MIVWLIGKSGAGKSTVGRLLFERIKEHHSNTVFLDGDILREVWGDNLAHTIDGRAVNASRISHLCRLLDRQGIHVVAAVLSIFPEWQKWNREHFSTYFQVFLDVPMETLRERDSKGLYKAAESGEIRNVVGVDIPFPEPVGSNLTLAGSQSIAPASTIAHQIHAALPPPLRRGQGPE